MEQIKIYNNLNKLISNTKHPINNLDASEVKQIFAGFEGLISEIYHPEKKLPRPSGDTPPLQTVHDNKKEPQPDQN